MKFCSDFADLAQEKTIEEINLFRKESLKRTETQEKNTLPTTESKLWRDVTNLGHCFRPRGQRVTL